MKKLISILLLTALLVYTGGSFIVFKYKEAIQKQEMMGYIQLNPQSALATQLHFSKQAIQNHSIQFEWEEEGQEFSYNGEMYDVVNSTVDNDSIRITAIKDKIENQLIEQYTSLVKHQSNSQSTTASLLKLFTSVFIATTNESTTQISNTNIVHVGYYSFKCSSAEHTIITPPPQV